MVVNRVTSATCSHPFSVKRVLLVKRGAKYYYPGFSEKNIGYSCGVNPQKKDLHFTY
jgi:hypothetical protein